ncbi:MAG: DMT family transporter [Cyanomargarita calcarea GSE-NOS-MK-12-04C]|jgi:drug/metabolite transporter (DMT)-like permease|uniref:DMT family transporter n=1 Tax=Cyanomargarita calcarea GSE-NOS-MK-12-04C TaxID=2839659 RepID=A0A951UW88_9CYAN|nr:DMT family transporter [Cyanomargarita calcarea GSE-NOS-MK-12-04C]
MVSLVDVKGELAAIGAACLWAVASVVYGRLGAHIPPLQLNLIKGVIAIALLLFTISIRQEFLSQLADSPLCLLLLSGIVGIGFGDIAFLAAINSLGASRTLLMGTLAPPMTAIGAMIFLQESLKTTAWCGILLTILGVAWVVTERVPNKGDNATNLWQGIGIGFLAAIANATGAILSRAALAHSNIPPLWAALLRLSAAVLMLLPWVWFVRRQSSFEFKIQSARVMAGCVFAAFCGTYLGIWLQQMAIKYTAVGVASTLLQTSPLFVLPIAVCIGEKVSLRAIAGVVVAIAGIGLLFYLK